MENRRRQKGDKYRQEVSGRRSQYKKPPRGSWQPSVPSWEKAFCKSVGLLDWETFLDMKKYVYLYDNIIKWNDSAGEEAFRGAKNRFWAKIHGLACDNDLPDPDVYIDEIDWESKIDAELLSDLECQPAVPDADEKSETVVIFGDSLMSNFPFSPAGWGESEEKFKKATDLSFENHDNSWEWSCDKSNGAVKENGQGDLLNNVWHLDKGGGRMTDDGWGDGWDNSWVVNHDQNQKVECEGLRYRNTSRDGAQGMWDVNDANRVTAGMSRSRVSRFSGEGQYNNYSWRNRKGKKRETVTWRQTNTGKTASSRGWNFNNACGPVTHHASDKAEQNWSWEKPVS